MQSRERSTGDYERAAFHAISPYGSKPRPPDSARAVKCPASILWNIHISGR
jgi:hypothetical protein